MKPEALDVITSMSPQISHYFAVFVLLCFLIFIVCMICGHESSTDKRAPHKDL